MNTMARGTFSGSGSDHVLKEREEEEALVGRAGEKRNAGPFVPLGGNSIGYLAA